MDALIFEVATIMLAENECEESNAHIASLLTQYYNDVEARANVQMVREIIAHAEFPGIANDIIATLDPFMIRLVAVISGKLREDLICCAAHLCALAGTDALARRVSEFVAPIRGMRALRL